MKTTLISLGIIILVGGGVFALIRQGPKQNEDLLINYQKTDMSQQVADNTVNNMQTQTSTPETKKSESHMVTIETNYGKIVFETYNNDAPKTVLNFITLADKGFYDNVIFHRVIKGFMIQGGDPTGTGTGGPGYKFEDELNPNTQSYKNGYKKGVVAMANSGPNTNGSQFFIMLEDNALPNLYTIFGRVVSGQDVVDTIGSVKTDGSDKPLEKVVIKKVTVKTNI